MHKVMFVRTEKVARGDGSGPVFERGKAYWLRADSANYWRSIDAVVDAPADMPAENEPPQPAVRAESVRLVRVKAGRFDVLGPGGVKINAAPLRAGEAEKLRQAVLAGKVSANGEAPPPDASEIERADASAGEAGEANVEFALPGEPL